MGEKRKKRRANGANGRRRTNGTGTIERRGDKWLARWYVYDAHGNRIRKSKTIEADGIDEARKQLKELTEGDALITREKEIRRNLTQLEGVAAQRREWEDKQPALAIADAFDAYRNGGQWRETAERTAEDYERYYQDFARWMAENRPERVELRDVTREDASAFAKDLREKTAAGTYNKRVVFLRRLWRVLMDCDKARLSLNPWETVSTRNVIEHTRRELTAEELAKVCAPLVGEMRTLFAIGVYTGLRLGDAALLDWGTVDLARRFISLIPSKTKRHAHGKPVLIPVHQTLLWEQKSRANRVRFPLSLSRGFSSSLPFRR